MHTARQTGIDVVGAIPWGTHICQFYQTKKDLVDILVPYFKAGLENNESCIWITSKPLGLDEATQALGEAVGNLDYFLSKGQIQITDQAASYTPLGVFDAGAVLEHLLEAEQAALKNAFDGLRVSGNASWLTPEQWVDFTSYESCVDSMMRRRKIIAICSYPLQCWEPVGVVDTVSNHRRILIKRGNEWELVHNDGHGYIARLKSRGLHSAEIGRRLGVSRQRIAQIVRGWTKTGNEVKTDNSNQPLSVAEAATLLGVHINTIRRWSDNGVLPAYRFGERRDRKFRRVDLDKFLVKCNKPPDYEALDD